MSTDIDWRADHVVSLGTSMADSQDIAVDPYRNIVLAGGIATGGSVMLNSLGRQLLADGAVVVLVNAKGGCEHHNLIAAGAIGPDYDSLRHGNIADACWEVIMATQPGTADVPVALLMDTASWLIDADTMSDERLDHLLMLMRSEFTSVILRLNDVRPASGFSPAISQSMGVRVLLGHAARAQCWAVLDGDADDLLPEGLDARFFGRVLTVHDGQRHAFIQPPFPSGM